MKESNFWILVILITCVNAFDWVNDDYYHKKQMQATEELKIKVGERTHLDSLYWEHLENCSFIHKDSVGVGYQGYLYDKYHRKYVKK
jgi:hypothetical protein